MHTKDKQMKIIRKSDDFCTKQRRCCQIKRRFSNFMRHCLDKRYSNVMQVCTAILKPYHQFQGLIN